MCERLLRSKGMYLTFLICLSLCNYAYQQDEDIVFPSQRSDQELATKINCRIGEVRHFKYNSVTNFWENIDGKIVVIADLSLSCLGNDTGGPYGAEGLKYKAQITRLTVNENEAREEPLLRRKKRGIGSFFSNAWRKVKNFFIGLFGGTPEQEENPSRGPEIEDRSPPVPPDETVEEEEDNPDDYVYDSLYSEPFKFVQMANGSVPIVWFTDQDTDVRIRNFKRHLVDAFASQLSLKPQHSAVVENTVMGEHLSSYNITMMSFTAAYSSELETEDLDFGDGSNSVTVDKFVTQEDILKFAPTSETAAVNDVNKMELKARQTQLFRNGKLISTSGSSSLSLFDIDVKSKRGKREAVDIVGYFRVHTDYELQLSRVQKRSVNNFLADTSDLRDTDFSAAGRTAELEEISIRQRLQDLQKSIGDTALFVESFIKDISASDADSSNEKLQIILEVVEQEVRFGLDKEPQSVAKEIRKLLSKQVLDDVCFINPKKCIDLLQLIARAGGLEAERVLLSYLKDDSLQVSNRREVADLISDISNPSPEVIDELISMLISNRLNPELLGPVTLGVSNLAVAAEDPQKKRLVSALVLILDGSWSAVEPGTDPLTLDTLEAIGNVGDVGALDKVLQVCREASQIDVQISCAHAMRFMSNVSDVQSWIEMKLSNSGCDTIHAIIGALLDNIHAQEMSGDDHHWPRIHFNNVDRILKKYLETSPPQFQCAISDTLRYFRRKKNSEAQDLAQAYFNEDTEPFQPGSNSRQRRDLWDDLNCNEWTEDNKYTPIQNKDEFFADQATYNKRRSCLAFRRLGLKGASADIYAGMFAGVKQPSEPPKYKLFSKYLSSVNFLGHETEIGSFYFYHNTGNTKSYIRILGKTRQEFRHEGCVPSDLRYRPITHIPLYQVQVSVVQLSLGIHLSSELLLETLCPAYDQYALKPLTNVRVGGEARGTILFARAAMNLGGNFNYHLHFTFTPAPDMCLRGQHGYDPMSISIEAYYQLWNVGKLRWGKPKTWKPDFLAWDITGADRRPWFNDTCVLGDDDKVTSATTGDDDSSPSPDSPADNPSVPQPPSDDGNEVLVVRA